MIAASGPAQWLRFSRWGYAGVSAAHVTGISLLFGAIAALDLRLLGAFRSADPVSLHRVCVPVAGFGLCLAIAAGLLLFSVRPAEYVSNPVFLAKLGLIAAGLVVIVYAHSGFRREPYPDNRARRAAAASLSIWFCVLVLGRMIAFTGD